MLETKLDNSKTQIRALEGELKQMQEQRDNSAKEAQVLEKRLANVVYKHGQAMLEMDELTNKLEYAYSKAEEAEENLRRSNELSAMEMEETITLMRLKEQEIAKAESRFTEVVLIESLFWERGREGGQSFLLFSHLLLLLLPHDEN